MSQNQRYYPVTQTELDSFLRPLGFVPIEVPNTHELVYGRRDNRGLRQITLRVYTGLNANGQSRARGKDAIRAAHFERLPDGKVVMLGGTTLVRRTPTWARNLASRIDTLERTSYSPLPDCPDCGCKMSIRRSKHGEFYGCTQYPYCRGTRQTA